MATWEPVDVDPIDGDGIREEDDKLDDGKITEIETFQCKIGNFS